MRTDGSTKCRKALRAVMRPLRIGAELIVVGGGAAPHKVGGGTTPQNQQDLFWAKETRWGVDYEGGGGEDSI